MAAEDEFSEIWVVRIWSTQRKPLENSLGSREREHAIITDEVLNLIPHFVTFMLEETQKFFNMNLPGVDLPSYFNCIRQDNAYTFDEGQIVQHFKVEFEAQINE